MEPLDDPRKLSFKFEVTPQSPLENLLDIGHSRSQRRTSSTQPSQSSSAALSTLDGISEKFRDTLRSFSEHGNSTDFLKTVNEIIELSHAFLPEKRSFVKALDASLDEFLAPEENGGLPEENIRDVLRHIKHALDESMQIQIDRKVLQELALALREMPSAKPLRRTDNDEGRPARRALDSDEEEEEAVEGAGGDEDDLEEETVTVDSDRMKIFKNPQFLETAKANIGLGMSAEKDVISATLKKVLDKVRDKRGYNWSFKGHELVESRKRDSTLLSGVISQKVVADPITKGRITDPVRSPRCHVTHIYERTSLMAILAKKPPRDTRGIKCSYLGCGNYISADNLMEDEDYARFLARNAAGNEDAAEEPEGAGEV